MRILVCGDREWKDGNIIQTILVQNATLLIEGGCRGADLLAKEAVFRSGMPIPVQEFKADWSEGKRAGPLRNQKMLDEGKPDVVLAFHNDINNSRGTKDMLSRAQKQGYKTFLVSSGDDDHYKLVYEHGKHKGTFEVSVRGTLLTLNDMIEMSESTPKSNTDLIAVDPQF